MATQAISFVVPFRYLAGREGRLETTCASLVGGKSPGDQVIVVDQSEEPSGMDVPCDIYIHDPRPVWNRAAAINFGVRAALKEWLFPMSIDLDLRGLADALKRLRDYMEDLRGSDSIYLAFYFQEIVEGMEQGLPYYGSHACVFSRAAWEMVGGFDERFDGWGWEGMDFLRALGLAGARGIQTDIILPHISHAIGEDIRAAELVNKGRFIEKWGDDSYDNLLGLG